LKRTSPEPTQINAQDQSEKIYLNENHIFTKLAKQNDDAHVLRQS